MTDDPTLDPPALIPHDPGSAFIADPLISEPPRDELDTPPSTEAEASLGDLDTAHRELEELSQRWAERMESIDHRDAGGVANVEQRSLLSDARRRFAQNRSALIAMTILTLLIVLSILVPMNSVFGHKITGCCSPFLFSHNNASQIDYAHGELSPSSKHPFGTDPQGRDLWLRAWKGGRISLAVAFTVALTILLVGMIYGAISGYLGGKLDTVMMRFLDALYGLPYLPFAIIFSTLVQLRVPDAHPLLYMVPALSLTTWFTAARIMRSQVLSLKENEYVEAAVSSGARWTRIVGRHIAPNTLGIMVVAIFLEVPNAILGEATLSFLGVGVQLPDTSWGKLAQEGYQDFHSNPHLVWVPGLLIATTVLSAIAVADGLRDALDPRGRTN